MRTILLLSLLLAPGLAPGQEARITAPDAVAPGNLIILRSVGSSGDGFAWFRLDDPDGLLVVDGGANAVAAIGRPGVYQFGLVAVKANPAPTPPSISVARHTVTVTGPAPAPDPPAPSPEPAPSPAPAPDPAPASIPTGLLYVTLVNSLDDPSTAPIRISRIKDELHALGCSWYVARDGGEVAGKFASYTARSGLPVCFISDLMGNVVATIPAPTSPDQIVRAVKKIRGVSPEKNRGGSR